MSLLTEATHTPPRGQLAPLTDAAAADHLIDVREVPNIPGWPRASNGKATHFSTFLRWGESKRLKLLKVGRRWCTTRRALLEFMESEARRALGPTPPTPASSAPVAPATTPSAPRPALSPAELAQLHRLGLRPGGKGGA